MVKIFNLNNTLKYLDIDQKLKLIDGNNTYNVQLIMIDKGIGPTMYRFITLDHILQMSIYKFNGKCTFNRKYDFLADEIAYCVNHEVKNVDLSFEMDGDKITEIIVNDKN